MAVFGCRHSPSRIHRTIGWLDNEQQQHWVSAHRKRLGILSQAKEALRDLRDSDAVGKARDTARDALRDLRDSDAGRKAKAAIRDMRDSPKTGD